MSATAGLIACGGSTEQPSAEDETTDETQVSEESDEVVIDEYAMEKEGIKLTPFGSPEFEDASLSINTIADGAITIEAGEVAFSFAVENYELGNQTPDAESKMCANSAKGQHIHLILNNGPYSAWYSSDFSKELENGHYEMLAFVSRSYHESIKNANAYVLDHFTIGDPEAEDATCNFDSKASHLFYSRPKANYIGPEETAKVMLDFYLVNVDLSENGYKVRATINDVPFMLTKWVPYFMEGLPMGEVKIKLELLDAEGNLVESPFNPVERVVMLAESEPLI
ncbi:MAG: phosphopeptide-binding protein [Bacteroidetes bacterium]|nr:phosphopeptide-binding protein [Bacteroidota bacterium]